MEAKEIEDKAMQYAMQFDDKYQVAMFKAFIQGAEWMQEQAHKEFLEASAEIEKQHVQDVRDLQEKMIEKACEWISNELMRNQSYDDFATVDMIKFVEDFKQAMKGRTISF